MAQNFTVFRFPFAQIVDFFFTFILLHLPPSTNPSSLFLLPIFVSFADVELKKG